MRLAFFLLALCSLFPALARAAEDMAAAVLRDEAAGYILPLPAGWREVTDPGLLEDLVARVRAVFVLDAAGDVPFLRGAVLPDDAQASPALMVFALDYTAFNLDKNAVQAIANDPQALTAAMANAMQEAYKENFPQSILINSHLGDDFFSLNLRTVLDFADERGTTRNRWIKVTFSVDRVLVLLTLYDGPPHAAYDESIASSVRAMRVLPEKALNKVLPPREITWLDYVLVVVAGLVCVFLILRVRMWVKK
ncbi:MAG: hypothetical protein LBN33_00360 [Desulfovibrio sp.]|nr:hypothetical protein [Desulfovibrio sp.]